MSPSSIRALLLASLLGLLGGVPRPAHADDVPAAARKDVEEAKALLAKGDPKSLAGAWNAISRARLKAAESIDYWELFVRVWRANKKPEAELWEKQIGPKEKAAPSSAVFDLLRARLEAEPAKQAEHLEKAVAKDPKAPWPRLLLAANLKARGEETRAEELVDAVLADHPGFEDALVAKTELMVEGGLSRSAADFAREGLAKKECPALRFALALALRRLGLEDAAVRPEALEAARKAVEGDPRPRFVAVLAELLDEAGKTPEAVALLKQHAERTKDAFLLGRLGLYAFRMGEYDAAVTGLATSATTDLTAARALALAHARRGRAKEARLAVAQVLARQPEAWAFDVAVELDLEDAAGLRRAAGTRTEPAAVRARALADAWEGKAAEVAAAVGKEAAEGAREGEDGLLLLVEARLHARLGPKAAAARKEAREARQQLTSGSGVPEAGKGPERIDVTAKSMDCVAHLVSYLRSACDGRFAVQGQTLAPAQEGDGTRTVGFALVGQAECGHDPRRIVRVNPTKIEGERVQLNIPQDGESWQAAEAAFKEGAAALVAEDAGKAAEAFGRAFEAEPAWYRARLLKALAASLAAGADLAALAQEAEAALSAWPDDWEGRSAALALTRLAGGEVGTPLKALMRHKEERSARRPERL